MIVNLYIKDCKSIRVMGSHAKHGKRMYYLFVKLCKYCY